MLDLFDRLLTRLADAVRAEPAIAVGLAAAVIGAAVAFGLPVTDDQRDSLLAVVAILAPILAGATIRGKVTPVDKP